MSEQNTIRGNDDLRPEIVKALSDMGWEERLEKARAQRAVALAARAAARDAERAERHVPVSPSFDAAENIPAATADRPDRRARRVMALAGLVALGGLGGLMAMAQGVGAPWLRAVSPPVSAMTEGPVPGAAGKEQTAALATRAVRIDDDTPPQLRQAEALIPAEAPDAAPPGAAPALLADGPSAPVPHALSEAPPYHSFIVAAAPEAAQPSYPGPSMTNSLPPAASEMPGGVTLLAARRDPVAPSREADETPPRIPVLADAPERSAQPSRSLAVEVRAMPDGDVVSTPAAAPGGIDIRLYLPSKAAETTAQAAALLLADAGFPAPRVGTVDLTIRENQVRFYHPADAGAAEAMALALGAKARDFTQSGSRPPDGIIEVWVAGDGAAATPARNRSVRQPGRSRDLRAPVPARVIRGVLVDLDEALDRMFGTDGRRR